MLSDTKIRKAGPTGKAYRLGDPHGLGLFVTARGTRIWQVRYRWADRNRVFTMGTYPDISLADARIKCAEIHAIVAGGRDPNARPDKEEAAPAPAAPTKPTFEQIAREWHTINKPRWKATHAEHVLDTLVREVFPALGARQIDQITAPQVLEVLRPIQARGAIEAAHRLRNRVAGAFDLAIATGLIEHNPAARIGKAMMPIVKNRRHPAVTTPEEARRVLASVDLIPAHPVTRLALRLLALTALRPGELRQGRWIEIENLDGAEPVWRIPAERMKNTRERLSDAIDHVVPLARQAVDVLQALKPLTGRSMFIFPSDRRYSDQPMSEQALIYLLNRAGHYGRQVPHGWRATFSTIMNERFPADRAVIDLMLAHSPKDRIESRYNRATHTDRRRKLAQEWADLLLAGMPKAVELLALPRT